MFYLVYLAIFILSILDHSAKMLAILAAATIAILDLVLTQDKKETVWF